MSIERILARFYNLEKFHQVFSNEQKEKDIFIINNRLKEVNEYIYSIKDITIKEERNNKINSTRRFENDQKEKSNIKLDLK